MAKKQRYFITEDVECQSVEVKKNKVIITINGHSFRFDRFDIDFLLSDLIDVVMEKTKLK